MAHFRLRWAPAFALLLIISQLGSTFAGPLMALDFGGESLRVSIVKPSKTPISVVLNEASKRKTSAQVAFVDGARILGDDAAALNVKYPEKVYSRIRDLLGKEAEGESISELRENFKLPYKIVPTSKDNPRAAILSDKGDIISGEELAASLIHLAREMTEASSGGSSILDCVITVPAFWGPTQRQALLDAAKISGINVMSLVNTHAAAALQYGIERDFSEGSKLVIFYDMGATSTVTALVKFSSFSIKEGSATKSYGQFEVLDVTWDDTLGGELLDILLIDHFASEFVSQNPDSDPRSSPKALAKLRRAVKRTKEILSANTFAPISVEELMNGKDFRSKIERSELESMATLFLDRVPKPLTQIIERNSLKIEDLSGVELLGGGSRVPAVKSALTNALSGRTLDMHLNADEAVVLGAGLFAANLSTSFKLRKFGMKDGITYPITIQFKESGRSKIENSDDGIFRPRALLPRMKALPARRMVPIPSDLKSDSLLVELSYNLSDPSFTLPPGTISPILATYKLTGIQEAIKKHNNTGKLSLHFKADESGIISLERGESIAEVTEEYTIKVPVDGQKLEGLDPEATKNMDPKILEVLKNSKTTMKDIEKLAKELKEKADANETNSEDSLEKEDIESASGSQTDQQNSTDKPKTPAPPQFKDVVKTRRKILKHPLNFTEKTDSLKALSPETVKASKKALDRLAREEEGRREASKLKNELEAYIISFSGKISEDEDVQSVTSEKQRSEFSDQLLKAEDWLYNEGENEQSPNVFRAKQEELLEIGDEIELRVREIKLLPKAINNAQSFLKNTKQTIDGWKSTKPWLNETDVEDLRNKVKEVENWLSTESSKQEKKKAHEKPSLISTFIDTRLDTLRKPFNTLKNKKKPKPPPAPKPKVQNETSETGDKEGEENKIRQEEDREPLDLADIPEAGSPENIDHSEL